MKFYARYKMAVYGNAVIHADSEEEARRIASEIIGEDE